MRNLTYYIPGIALIAAAVLIVAVPEILVALVASLVLMSGVAALYIGHWVRQSRGGSDRIDRWFFEDHFGGNRYRRRPFAGLWNWRF